MLVDGNKNATKKKKKKKENQRFFSSRTNQRLFYVNTEQIMTRFREGKVRLPEDRRRSFLFSQRITKLLNGINRQKNRRIRRLNNNNEAKTFHRVNDRRLCFSSSYMSWLWRENIDKEWQICNSSLLKLGRSMGLLILWSCFIQHRVIVHVKHFSLSLSFVRSDERSIDQGETEWQRERTRINFNVLTVRFSPRHCLCWQFSICLIVVGSVSVLVHRREKKKEAENRGTREENGGT